MRATSKSNNSKKVVVFGSCNIDLFFDMPNLNFFVDVSEGVEDQLHFDTHQQAPGGKGANQAVAAAKAGAKVHFFGAVGKGGHGRFLLENFHKVGINTKGVKELNAPTGVAVFFNKPNGKHKATISHAANMLARQKDVPDSILGKDTVMIFQAETDLRENAALAARGKKRGATIVYNSAANVNLSQKLLANIDYLIVNRPEAEAIALNLGISASDLSAFAQTMTKKYKIGCVVTLGELGVLASLPGMDACVTVPCLKVKAVDTVGAGDAFTGAFAAALAKNLSPVEALRHGAVAGSLACTKVGAQSALPTAREIAKHLPKIAKLKAPKALQVPLKIRKTTRVKRAA